MTERHAYRTVDGEQIKGTWRPVFINNGGTYFLTDLVVYADGLIQCWEDLTLDELREKVASGWITVTPQDGARGSAFELAGWEFAKAYPALTGDELVAEVADTIEQLAGRPTADQRCYAALEVFRREPTEANREALRAAYLAVPEHQRMYLGDMDVKDWPFRVLITPVGERLFDGRKSVTAADHEEALGYFAEQDDSIVETRRRRQVDGPVDPTDETIVLASVYGTWPEPPSHDVLRAEYPAPVEFAGRRYPTISRAYWALAVADPDRHDEIVAARSDYAAQQIVLAAGVRDGWAASRAAVMAALLRAKFAQHPELRAVLLATGDGRLVYRGAHSDHFDVRNLMGRLLEQVRAECAADRAGLL